MGKKANEWRRERRKRIRELVSTGKYIVDGDLLFGRCSRCHKWGLLDLHHKDGRSGFEPHRMANLEPICRSCHAEEHMPSKDKKTNKKKAKWEMEHKCKNCKAVISMLLCPHCGKISV